MVKEKYKSGYVAVIGKPNVGKSTLINTLIGQKLNIVTSRPQTTRNKIIGIKTTDKYQIIFIDTPGIHKPKTLLGQHMIKEARSALNDADIVLFLIESYGMTPEDELVSSVLKDLEKPVFLIINKVDLVNKETLLPLIESTRTVLDFKEIFPISAIKEQNLSELMDKLIENLPLGPQYYPEDELSDKQERFFATEIIREQALRFLQEEVPHSVGIRLDEMKDRSERLSYIKATILIERDSQKMIVVGKNGQQIKKIGECARKELEKFLNRKVYLELWAKVSKDWRENPAILRTLGYG
jgi:GTP-binding protein Era